MSELHRNVIGGEWVAGEGIPNFSPSNTHEVVGFYARASADDAKAAIAAARDASSVPGIQQRHDILKAAPDEIFRRREEIGRLLAREEGKTFAEATAEATRGAQIFARLRRKRVERSPRHRGRHNTRAGRSSCHHYAMELPDRNSSLENCAGARLRQHRRVQAGRSGAGLRMAARRHPDTCGPAEGRLEPRHGQGFNRRPD